MASWGDTWQSDSWSCSLCGSGNWAKKKVCRSCGAKKLYAQAAAAAQSWPHPPQPRPPQPPAQPNTTAATHANAATPDAAPKPGKAKLIDRIKALDAARKLLTDAGESGAALDTLDTQSLEAKAAIVASKPWGAQLDGAKAAHARAQARAVKAQAAIELAQQQLDEAHADEEKYQLEIAKLESQVTATGAPRAQSGHSSLVRGLQDMVGQLRHEGKPWDLPQLLDHLTGLIADAVSNDGEQPEEEDAEIMDIDGQDIDLEQEGDANAPSYSKKNGRRRQNAKTAVAGPYAPPADAGVGVGHPPAQQ